MISFILNRNNLFKVLHSMISIINSKSIFPLLSCFLFNIRNNNLRITASDLDIEISTNILINACGINFKIALNANKIYNIIRNLADNSQIFFKINNYKIIIVSDNSTFNLISLNTCDYPFFKTNINQLVSFKITQKSFYNIISKVYFSMANNDVRYFLNGIFLEINSNTIKLVSSDGHRMSIVENIIDIIFLDKNILPLQLIIPRKLVLELKKLLNKDESYITINLNKNYLKAMFNNYVIISKLIDGRYPNYQNVIPKNNNKLLLVDKLSLKNSLLRASIFANNQYNGVRVNISKNQLILSVENNDEMIKDIIKIEYQYEDIEICFNYKYLLDVINVLSEDIITIYFNNSNTSILIKDEKDNSLFIIMPMKI